MNLEFVLDLVNCIKACASHNNNTYPNPWCEKLETEEEIAMYYATCCGYSMKSLLYLLNAAPVNQYIVYKGSETYYSVNGTIFNYQFIPNLDGYLTIIYGREHAFCCIIYSEDECYIVSSSFKQHYINIARYSYENIYKYVKIYCDAGWYKLDIYNIPTRIFPILDRCMYNINNYPANNKVIECIERIDKKKDKG